ncbi:MAG: type III-B CRISPR module RAMP protein Cmr1 [Lewinellaceae bacterium]|nr:type III-B CRISPR module RAMP protein Cmr1 [Lewinellaceae bacterium]
MQPLKFTCKVITPLFLGGADGEAPELRAPSIKGGMRYWWRAMHANLPIAEMQKREARIFGGASPGQRSKVLIRIPDAGKNHGRISAPLAPHKDFMRKDAIEPGEQFTLQLTLMAGQPLYEYSKLEPNEQLEKHFILTCLLGGFGKRVRRGMGSVGVVSIQRSGEPEVDYQMPVSLNAIHELMSSLAPKYFELKDTFIISRFIKADRYPYIKEIHLGRGESRENLLMRISNATHQFKEQNDRKIYEASMGHAFKGRFASPVYISTVEHSGALHPIITRLYTHPDYHHKDGVDLELQSKFIDAVKQ